MAFVALFVAFANVLVNGIYYQRRGTDHTTTNAKRNASGCAEGKRARSAAQGKSMQCTFDLAADNLQTLAG